VYEFLLTGRDNLGRKFTEIVEADSGDEAVRTFEAQGHKEITLHTDDCGAQFSKPSKMRALWTPRQLVALRTKSLFVQSLSLVGKLCRIMWFILLPAAGWLAHWALAGEGWGVFETIAAALLLIPVAFALYLWLSPSGLPYSRTLRAVGWARWEEVLRLLPRLEKCDLPASEVPVRRAQALAGLGRLAEALTGYAVCREQLPGFMFWGYQALIYQAAGDRPRVLAALERAYELAPTLPAILIDYATALVMVRRDTRQARDLLAEARRHAVSDTAQPFLLAGEGLVELEEGRPAEAVERLEEAIRLVDPFLRGNPSVLVSGARIRAHLCLSHAALGDTSAARRRLREARPLLLVHHVDDLLQRCEEAVG